LDYSKKKCIFIVKKLVLIDFPALEAAGYYVIWGILGAGNKRKLICNLQKFSFIRRNVFRFNARGLFFRYFHGATEIKECFEG
jgi:hypothetical protein